jgi:hypothetical protein
MGHHHQHAVAFRLSGQWPVSRHHAKSLMQDMLREVQCA